ncbi:G-protein alpha subunit [Epithele typhae]|uniref:G-protein alpha subunit n=1 Tax=Epithele typhae TaxID=378194 RepID=UPI002008787B|nr:G-protein alpha subunit [Epithele typhae]KAH9941216.1 G-protein alpha subunit [Epithele typhae]
MSSSENAWPPPPPAGETDLEKELRTEEEREAKRVSDAIDRVLEAERQTMRKKRREEVRLLLLGQSESGKSTLLKNFQLMYTPTALHAEAAAWRAVVHLNLVRSVNFILDFLTSHTERNSATPGSSDGHSHEHGGHRHRMSSLASGAGQGSGIRPSEVRRYKLALSPLLQVEVILVRQLRAADSPRSPVSSPTVASPTSATGHSFANGLGARRGSKPDLGTAEGGSMDLESGARGGSSGGTRHTGVVVPGGKGWKQLFGSGGANRKGKDSAAEELADARRILDACKTHIAALWADPDVRAALRDASYALEEQSGFFLDQALTVADASYEPTVEDILRARLQTAGVEEHRLIMETSAEHGQQWVFYDVGGSRGQRASWVPFFEDVNAIIFMVSTAGFCEVLAEDRSVNRLADSFNLWKTICSSKLLILVHFMLVLNKMDILKTRLTSGIEFSSFVPSYKGSNDVEGVTEYLKRKFTVLHHHHSPQKRHLHVHSTCAINVQMTSAVLTNIRNTILVNSLTSTHII